MAGVAFLAAVALSPLLIISRSGSPSIQAPADAATGAAVLGPAVSTAGSATSGPSTISATTTSATTTSATTTSAGTTSAARTTAAAGAAAVLARPVLPRPVATPPRTTYQEFLSVCAPLGTGRAPLGDPAGSTGPAVPVDFLGAPPSGAGLSPPAAAVPGRSSCLNAADRSSYWAPQLTVGGRPVAPDSAEIYYKSPVRDYTGVQPFPAGLRLEAGPGGSWSCGGERSAGFPASCPAGAKLVARVQSPGCWDGVRLDSPGHRAHLTRPTADRCPGTHPVPVPMLELKLVYPVPAGPLLARLPTGDGTTVRFGFISGWDGPALLRLVSGCIAEGLRCGSDGTPA